LNEALKHAVKWQLVARNVVMAVDPPRAEYREMQVLDAQGVHRLLEAARDTMYYPVLHLAIYTGLRRSELLGLRWKDVDLDMAAIYVVQTSHQLTGGRIVYQEPKTAKGKRQVSLSPTAVLALRAYLEKVEAERDFLGISLTPDSLVFSHYDGSPMLANTITHAYLKIARRVGLQGVRFHDLRHTHATMMLKANVHPKVVMERLGHSQIAVTLDTYSHVVPGMQEKAALAFDAMLKDSSLMPTSTVR
jgi:integrase